MDDSISRHAAISAYKTLCQGTACKGCPFFDSKGMKDCRLLKALRKVQSAQPEVTEEAVKEYCRKRCLCIVDSALLKKYASAQPKAGKWILIRPDEDKAGNGLYECSECGKGDIHAPEVEVPFCWNCGARMTGSGSVKERG